MNEVDIKELCRLIEAEERVFLAFENYWLSLRATRGNLSHTMKISYKLWTPTKINVILTSVERVLKELRQAENYLMENLGETQGINSESEF